MHTTAEQYSPQKKIHLFICTNPGKCWIAIHIDNLAEFLRKAYIQGRVRGAEGVREQTQLQIGKLLFMKYHLFDTKSLTHGKDATPHWDFYTGFKDFTSVPF